MDVGSDPL